MKFKQGSKPTVPFKEVPSNVPFSILELRGTEGGIYMKFTGNLKGKPFEGILDMKEGYAVSLDTFSDNSRCVVYKNAELVLNL